MSDRSFRSAVQMIGVAKDRAPDVATNFIFNQYRTADQDKRDAIVLALIGEVVADAARRRASAPQAAEDA